MSMRATRSELDQFLDRAEFRVAGHHRWRSRVVTVVEDAAYADVVGRFPLQRADQPFGRLAAAHDHRTAFHRALRAQRTISADMTVRRADHQRQAGHEPSGEPRHARKILAKS